MARTNGVREMLPDEQPRERMLKWGSAQLKTSELIVILPETTTDGASVVAERIRGTLAERTNSHRLTVSIGVAEVRDSEAMQASLIQDADAALYRAKRLGKNRVE